MKLTNYFLFALLASAVLFTSCGGDDSLEGTWMFLTSTTTNCDDATENGSITLSSTPCTATSEDGCSDATITFAGTTVTQTFNFTFNGEVTEDVETGTYSQDGDVHTLCFDSDCENFTATFDGDRVTLVSDADVDGCVYTLTGVKQ